jgi:hypothetical protein
MMRLWEKYKAITEVQQRTIETQDKTIKNLELALGLARMNEGSLLEIIRLQRSSGGHGVNIGFTLD